MSTRAARLLGRPYTLGSAELPNRIVMLNTYLRDREISQHLTNLARQIAVRDAELTRRENDLEQRLTALEQQATTNGHRPATTEPAATASADEVGTARSTGS